MSTVLDSTAPALSYEIVNAESGPFGFNVRRSDGHYLLTPWGEKRFFSSRSSARKCIWRERTGLRSL